MPAARRRTVAPFLLWGSVLLLVLGATCVMSAGSQRLSDDPVLLLSGSFVDVKDDGVVVEGSNATIVAGGTYVLRGVLQNGRITVDVGKDETVQLTLEGATLSSESGAAIYIVSADETRIVMSEGTSNRVTGGGSAVDAGGRSDADKAAIFSADDLWIGGSGSLEVESSAGNGIQCKDDLEVMGGIVSVVASGDGIRARDSIVIDASRVTVVASGDGLRASNDEDPERGTMVIESGVIDVTAGEDGLQAETDLIVRGGEIVISAGGGSAHATETRRDPWGRWMGDSDGPSQKGMKAGVELLISGGAIEIDSADDGIHSDDLMIIDGGTLSISSGDDGIHADTQLVINGGDIVIAESYEGIESSVITLNGGTIRLSSRDDGINAAGGDDGLPGGGRPGWGRFETTGTHQLFIHGGWVTIEAGGDGIDVNGPITMTAGTVIVHGPTTSMNGALDYSGSFDLSGGVLVALGSAGMAQAPSATSAQNSVAITFGATLAAGQLIHIESADGDELVTVAPKKAVQSAVISLPDLTGGEGYTIYTGGTSTGTVTDGLYTNGSYAPGTEWASFTVESTVTSVRAGGSAFPPGGRRRDG